ncbi:uncharacterized protein [Lolium perenne]|uniref:uncharacterized protein n=1 Tax=Lolium perenne TaxID=4522 RepID=UPI003A9A0AE4
MADGEGGGGGGEGGGSSECLPMDNLVEAMVSNSQAMAEALAADRARREATDRIQRESWEAALKEKDAEIGRLRAEAADAKNKLQADARRNMRWEAAYELLLGANQKLAELRDADMQDSRTLAETPNSKEVESSQTTVDHTASNFRKLKQAYETKKDKEVSALLSEKNSLHSQLDIMQKDYAELLKNKKVEAAQATEAAIKLQQSVDEHKALGQNKDAEIARLQVEAVGGEKKYPLAVWRLDMLRCNLVNLNYTKLLKSKKVLTQKKDHEINILRAEVVGAKRKVHQMHSLLKEKDDEIQRLKGWHVEFQKHYKKAHRKSRSVDPAVTPMRASSMSNDCEMSRSHEDADEQSQGDKDDDDGQSRSDEHDISQSGHDKETMNNPILKPLGNHKRKRDACNAETANGKSHVESNR